MAKKILLTGASGLLGANVLRHFAGDKRVTLLATQRDETFQISEAFSRGEPVHHLDITNQTDVWNLFSQWLPDVVIHTAAMTEAPACEWNRQLAFDINVGATELLAKLCDHFSAKLIFISTDLVFDGTKGNYLESDDRKPLNYYGETKLQAENLATSLCETTVVLRTSLLLGKSPRGSRSLDERLITDLRAGKNLTLFTDEFRNPIRASTLATVIDAFIFGDAHEASGVFHAASRNAVSRYDLGLSLAKQVALPTDLISPALHASVSFSPPRPRDCRLITDKLHAIVPLPTWEEEARDSIYD
jgi:dTDP-4-dehydrorhamnose reductase